MKSRFCVTIVPESSCNAVEEWLITLGAECCHKYRMMDDEWGYTYFVDKPRFRQGPFVFSGDGERLGAYSRIYMKSSLVGIFISKTRKGFSKDLKGYLKKVKTKRVYFLAPFWIPVRNRRTYTIWNKTLVDDVA